MLSFECDYNNGCLPEILEALQTSNDCAEPGYGFDSFTEKAKKKIRDILEADNAEIYFLAGGTQTNLVAISSVLDSFEGVVAAETAHVATHESGAIEYTGHKVLTLPSHNGKIDAGELESYLQQFYSNPTKEHTVFPGMVYISSPTELGTLYSKKELEAIHAVTKAYDMKLYLDGARLGYGLMSKENDICFSDLKNLVDLFYIGGTKVGALFGEALVFPNGDAPKQMFTRIKQHGALLAKGRAVAVQFDTLFTDNLYLKVSGHAIDLAEKLKEKLKKQGIRFYMETSTNQQFVILENSELEKLSGYCRVDVWDVFDENHTVVRFCTSWSTKETDIDMLFSN